MEIKQRPVWFLIDKDGQIYLVHSENLILDEGDFCFRRKYGYGNGDSSACDSGSDTADHYASSQKRRGKLDVKEAAHGLCNVLLLFLDMPDFLWKFCGKQPFRM